MSRHVKGLTRTATTVAAVAVALTTVACGGPEDPAAPATSSAPTITTSAPSPAATATPVPSPPATASALPSTNPSTTAVADPACPTYDDGYDPDYVAIAAHRFGSVCLGMTFAEASATMPGAALEGEPMCPWLAHIVEADPLYIQAISSPQDESGPITLFHLIYLGDPVTAPPHEMPATAEGIAIGSTLEDVLDAYPGARELTLDDPARGSRDQVVVESAPARHYVFDVVDGVVAELTWGADLEDGIAGELCAL